MNTIIADVADVADHYNHPSERNDMAFVTKTITLSGRDWPTVDEILTNTEAQIRAIGNMSQATDAERAVSTQRADLIADVADQLREQ